MLVGAGPSDELRALEKHAPSEQVTVASKGAAFVEMAASEQFSLVVCDVALPGLSHDDLARVLEKIEHGKTVPVVILSTELLVRSFLRELTSKSDELGSLVLSTISNVSIARQATGAGAGVSSSPKDDDDRAVRKRVLEAAFRERERLLRDSLSTQEVASLLGVTRQTPHDRAKQRTLLAVEDKNQQRFPPWQFDAFDDNGVVNGLPEVLRALAASPLAQARWLTSTSPVFEGRTPLQALKEGEVERVVNEARGVGAQAGSAHG
jgi:CheY-like chemotaxis protein